MAKRYFHISTVWGEVVEEVPFVYCPNLIAKVTDIVEHHIHQSTCRYLMNTQHPNSQKNTTLVSILKQVLASLTSHTVLDMYKTSSQKNMTLVSIFKAGKSLTNLPHSPGHVQNTSHRNAGNEAQVCHIYLQVL